MIESDFIKLIHNRFGLVIHLDQAGALTHTLKEACRQFHCTPEEYYLKLQECPSTSPLLTFLIAGITVGESYFFRDKHQMQLLEKILLPRLLQKKDNFSLRIWSAGCSSGEEIYTIALMLNEMHLPKWDIQLLGTDINRKALEKAKQGIYNEWSMRSMDNYYKERYFTKKDNSYELSLAIRQRVKFDYQNLMDSNYPSILNGTNDQDLILCRNVFIYFDDEVNRRIIKKLSACLVKGGYFLFGASDPIMIHENQLVFHHEEGAIYFSLEDGGG
jgi:chemotaxis protein methyltransferase CheR